MNNNETRNSINRFELEGNVASVGDIYTNKKGKVSLRFELGQNNKDNSQFVPIVIKGELVNSYGKEIQVGDWISVKGRILSYPKKIEKDGREYNNKTVDILGFEIKDITNQKIYKQNGNIEDIKNKNERER